jgi:hypothetical protein
LRPLFERAKKMSATFDSFGINHVYREQNQDADALANEALDETAGTPAGGGAMSAKSTGGKAAAPAAASDGAVASASAGKAAAAPAKPAAKHDPSIPRKVKARFRSGILYPLEDLDLEDGCEVEIYLRATPKKEKL